MLSASSFMRPKAKTEQLYLIKKQVDEEEPDYEPYGDDAFLMKYNFVPPNCKILNIFCTNGNTFLLTSFLKYDNFYKILSFIYKYKASGRLFSWGIPSSALGRQYFSHTQAKIPEEITTIPKRVLTLATGHDHVLALDFEGKIYAWGDNTQGQVFSQDIILN